MIRIGKLPVETAVRWRRLSKPSRRKPMSCRAWPGYPRGPRGNGGQRWGTVEFGCHWGQDRMKASVKPHCSSRMIWGYCEKTISMIKSVNPIFSGKLGSSTWQNVAWHLELRITPI